MTFKGGTLREKIICNQCENEATSKMLPRINSLICTPNKQKSPLATVDCAWKKKFSVPNQNHLYFIILCYKGLKDTIAPDGSQFTRYSCTTNYKKSAIMQNAG